MEKLMKNKTLIRCIGIILVIIYVVCICPINIQNDIFFDIKVGENYITNGINTNDEFSFHENLKYVSHHFMVNIITYLVYFLTGLKGIYILEVFLAMILAYLFYKANKIYVKNNIIAYLLVFMELILMQGFISQRAQMYSYILFLLEIICIEKFLRTDKKTYLVIVSIMPLLIVNFHAGVLPFYFVIIFVYLLNYFNIKIRKIENEKNFKKNLKYLFIPIISGFVLMFCNPFGLDGILYSFKTISNDFISKNIAEFLPSNIYNNIFYYIYIVFIFFSYILTNKNLKIHQLLLVLGTSFMTLLSLRHFSLLVIVSVTSMNIIEELIVSFYNYLKIGIDKSKIDSFKNAMIIGTLFIVSLVAINSIVYMDKNLLSRSFYSLEGVEYIKNNIPDDKRIYNEYSWGSLMMVNNIKVFIDSRCDLYTEEYNKDVTVAKDYIDVINCKKDYNIILKKYDIDYVFIKNESELNEFLKNDDSYNQVYSDEISVIYEVEK